MSITSAQTAEFNARRGLTTVLVESGGNMTPVVLTLLYWLDLLAEKVKSVKSVTPRVTVAKAEVEKDEMVNAINERVVTGIRQIIFEAIKHEDPRVSFLLFDALSDVKDDVKVCRDLVMAGMNISVPTEDGEDVLPWDEISDVEIAKESLRSFASMIPMNDIPAEFLTEGKDGPAINMKRWRALTTLADSNGDVATTPESGDKSDQTKVTTWNLNGENIEVTGLAWLAVFHASDYSNIITHTELQTMIEEQTGKPVSKYNVGESFTVTVPSGTLTGTVKNKA